MREWRMQSLRRRVASSAAAWGKHLMPIRQATRLQAVMRGWRDRGYILGNTHLDRLYLQELSELHASQQAREDRLQRLVDYSVPDWFWAQSARQTSSTSNLVGCKGGHSVQQTSPSNGQDAEGGHSGARVLDGCTPTPAGASLGAPEFDASSYRRFVPVDSLPDEHLPWEFQWGREYYDSLMSYDAWLRGKVLDTSYPTSIDADIDADNTSFFTEAIEQGDPECEAARVTCLLKVILPFSSKERYPPEWSFAPLSVDARRPVTEQLAAFSHFGHQSPPAARTLLSFMAKHAQRGFDVDKKLNPGKQYAYSQQAFYGPATRRSRKRGPADGVDDSYDGLDSLGATDDMFGVGHARGEASGY